MADEARHSRGQSVTMGGTAFADGAARTILVVEDEPVLRMIAVDVLEEAGWSVIEFPTADEAAAFWAMPGNDVGAVFTDINMPGSMDGLDLAALVAGTNPSAVLVVTSGRYQQPPADLARHVQFLPKPWRAQQLLAALRLSDADGPLPPPVLPEP